MTQLNYILGVVITNQNDDVGKTTAKHALGIRLVNLNFKEFTIDLNHSEKFIFCFWYR